MKNIAVLVYDLTIEYNVSVLNGIVAYFEKKDDVKLIISPVNVPYAATGGGYDYQYWSAVEILKSQCIDAAIIISNSFCHYLSNKDLSDFLKVFLPRPIISIAQPFEIENSRYTYISCQKVYEDVVEHIIKKHNKKKIAFFSAELTKTLESKERLDAYKSALKKFNLEYHEEWVFPGDFTPGTAEAYVREHFKSKEDVDFDALLCANDYTATGAMLAFKELGVKIPEDLIFFGFDDSQVATTTFPSLSTISQHVAGTGEKAAEMAYKMLCGQEVEKAVETNCCPVYRQSCGCVKSDSISTSFYDADGGFHEYKGNDTYAQFSRNQSNLTTIYNLLNTMDSNNGLDDFFLTLKQNLDIVHLSSIDFCFYNQPIEIERKEDFSLPANTNLIYSLEVWKQNQEEYSEKNAIPFSSAQYIVPNKFAEKNTESGVYILLPIFLKKLNYGYMFCKTSGHNYTLYSIYLKILTNSIIQAYEYSKEKNTNKELAKQNLDLSFESKTDELTGIFNRRGFLLYAQQMIDMSLKLGKEGFVFFFDMDGLKKINDTYGHKMGDLAIKTQAQVLKLAFRDSDVIGRLSGDEFAVVAPGFKAHKLPAVSERLEKLNTSFSEENKLPFVISASFGPVRFDSEHSCLKDLLALADKKLYEEKRIKHNKSAD